MGALKNSARAGSGAVRPQRFMGVLLLIARSLIFNSRLWRFTSYFMQSPIRHFKLRPRESRKYTVADLALFRAMGRQLISMKLMKLLRGIWSGDSIENLY